MLTKKYKNISIFLFILIIVFSLLGVIPNPLLDKETAGVIVDQVITEYPAEGKIHSFLYVYCIDNKYFLKKFRYNKVGKIGNVYEIRYSSIFNSMSKINYQNTVDKKKVNNIECLNYCFKQYEKYGSDISKWDSVSE